MSADEIISKHGSDAKVLFKRCDHSNKLRLTGRGFYFWIDTLNLSPMERARVINYFGLSTKWY